MEREITWHLAAHPDWWVADTRDWRRPAQLVAPPENLLLRVGDRRQLEQDTGSPAGIVVAAVPTGPISAAQWRRQLEKVGATIEETE